MSARRGGLGRGLGALIPTAPVGGDGPFGRTDGGEAPIRERVSRESHARDSRETGSGAPDAGARLVHVNPAEIRPNARQPRTEFDEDLLAELVASIREVGVLQPVVVRPAPLDAEGTRYELVMGERRWRASQLAGLTEVPAIVRHTDDDAMLLDALLENLHRAQLNPLEEAAAYQQLLQEFGATHEELAGRIGKSRPQISNTIRLLNLPPAVQRRVAAGVLSAGHARALLGLPDAGSIEALAARIVAEGLSVRAVEEIVALGAAPGKRRAGRPRRSASAEPAALELAERVSDRLDTRVHVELGRAKSRLVVEIADLEDLARVVELIAGPAAPRETTEQDRLNQAI